MAEIGERGTGGRLVLWALVAGRSGHNFNLASTHLPLPGVASTSINSGKLGIKMSLTELTIFLSMSFAS